MTISCKGNVVSSQIGFLLFVPQLTVMQTIATKNNQETRLP